MTEVIFTTPEVSSPTGTPITPSEIERYDTATGASATLYTVAGGNIAGLTEDTSGNIYFGFSSASSPLTVFLDELSADGAITQLAEIVNTAGSFVDLANEPVNLTYDPQLNAVLYTAPQLTSSNGSIAQSGFIGAYSLTTGDNFVLAQTGNSPGGITVDPSGDIFYTTVASGPYSISLSEITNNNGIKDFGEIFNSSDGFVSFPGTVSDLSYDQDRKEVLFTSPDISGSSGSIIQAGSIGALDPATGAITTLFQVPGNPEGLTADTSGNVFTTSTATGPYQATIYEDGIAGPQLFNTAAGFLSAGFAPSLLVTSTEPSTGLLDITLDSGGGWSGPDQNGDQSYTGTVTIGFDGGEDLLQVAGSTVTVNPTANTVSFSAGAVATALVGGIDAPLVIGTFSLNDQNGQSGSLASALTTLAGFPLAVTQIALDQDQIDLAYGLTIGQFSTAAYTFGLGIDEITLSDEGIGLGLDGTVTFPDIDDYNFFNLFTASLTDLSLTLPPSGDELDLRGDLSAGFSVLGASVSVDADFTGDDQYIALTDDDGELNADFVGTISANLTIPLPNNWGLQLAATIDPEDSTIAASGSLSAPVFGALQASASFGYTPLTLNAVTLSDTLPAPGTPIPGTPLFLTGVSADVAGLSTGPLALSGSLSFDVGPSTDPFIPATFTVAGTFVYNQSITLSVQGLLGVIGTSSLGNFSGSITLNIGNSQIQSLTGNANVSVLNGMFNGAVSFTASSAGFTLTGSGAVQIPSSVSLDGVQIDFPSLLAGLSLASGSVEVSYTTGAPLSQDFVQVEGSELGFNLGLRVNFDGSHSIFGLTPAASDFAGAGMSGVLWQYGHAPNSAGQQSGAATSGDPQNGTTAIWLMDGTTPTAEQVVATPPAGWNAVTTGDFNGDGYSDILWQYEDTGNAADPQNGNVAIWEMDGTSAIAAAVVAEPGPNWDAVATGDFNGDGYSDILWQYEDAGNASDPQNGNVAIWLMNGLTPIAAAVVAQPGPDWNVIGTGDFNGDGKSDILWQYEDSQNASDPQNGNVAIWEMNGLTPIAEAVIAQPGPDWHVVGTGDFNGDGKADILWQYEDTANSSDPQNGNVAIWLMNGTTPTAEAVVATPGSAWQVIGTGDYDGSGRSDILWQNTDGQAAIWLMNGLTPTTESVFAAPPSSWHVIPA